MLLKERCNFYQVVTHGGEIQEPVIEHGDEFDVLNNAEGLYALSREHDEISEEDFSEVGGDIHGGEVTEEQIIEGIIRQQGTVVPIGRE